MLIRAAVAFSVTFVLGPLRYYISTYFWKAGCATVGQKRMPSTNIYSSRSALPSEWDKRQWGRHQTVQQYLKVDGCTVKYVGPGETDKQAASIYADHPVPADAAAAGQDSRATDLQLAMSPKVLLPGVGFCSEGVNLGRLPGWEDHSYGYHGDDGNAFHGSGSGQLFGPKFTTGIWNGTCVGTAFHNVQEATLYPCVGMRTPNEEIKANFGAASFSVNLAELQLQYRQDVLRTISARLALRCPKALVFDEIGSAAMGAVGSALVYGSIYVSILCVPIILHLTCMETLQQTFYMYNLSKPMACIIVTVLIIPLAQMHQMEDLAWVSILGTVGMLGAMLIVVGKLIVLYINTPVAAATEVVATSGGFHSSLVGAMDIAFAFGFMTAIFLLVSVTGYAAFGTAIDMEKPISSVVGQDIWGVMLNAGIFLHCIIAYQVNVNVWSSLLLHLTVPKYAEELSLTNSWSKKGLWMAITLLCIAFAGTVAYIFPFFSIVMAVIASLGDVMSMFGLPCLFAIKLLRLPKWEELHPAELMKLITPTSSPQQLQEIVALHHAALNYKHLSAAINRLAKMRIPKGDKAAVQQGHPEALPPGVSSSSSSWCVMMVVSEVLRARPCPGR
eukprot:gene2276-2588_t